MILLHQLQTATVAHSLDFLCVQFVKSLASMAFSSYCWIRIHMACMQHSVRETGVDCVDIDVDIDDDAAHSSQIQAANHHSLRHGNRHHSVVDLLDLLQRMEETDELQD